MTEEQHTPLRWKADGVEIYRDSEDKKYREAVATANPALAAAYANAELIARACNSHGALVHALTLGLKVGYKNRRDQGVSDAEIQEELWFKAATNALKRAEPKSTNFELIREVGNATYNTASEAVDAVYDLPEELRKRAAMAVIEHNLNIDEVQFAGEFMLKFFGARE